ncbi:hypothetical protein DPMN_082968 [Dreissena polymorpha]|uniref:VWFC domain-containing protein n=2 Tax=Dreissena polymorpha TaxID=45954 RepID=A0A9D3Y7X8_DREPO|nr:hypothetical protein DPMN_082968 [Dreissena polymorpha]
MSTLRVFALAFACAVSCVDGDFTLTGVCPDGRQAGERWVPKEDPCSECSCNHLGWGCDSCPILTPIIGCYPVQAAVLPYPECCPRLVCPPFQP